jgi:hypothetical protein
MLERDANEANGNVRRMLSVCSEFERIARVALDKADRELKGRGKRKQAEREKEKDRKDTNSIASGLEEGKTLEMIQVETQAAYRRPVQTPSLRKSMESSAQGSPASWGSSPAGGSTGGGMADAKRSSRNMDGFDTTQNLHPQHAQQPMPPPSAQFNQQPGFAMPNGNFPQQDFGNGNNLSQFTQSGMSDGTFNPTTTGFSPPDPTMAGMDLTNAFNANQDMLSGTGSFQQPFVPQDLWQMPMTLEWDWAEGLGLGSFTPGPMFDGYGQDGMLGGNMNAQGQQ